MNAAWSIETGDKPSVEFKYVTFCLWCTYSAFLNQLNFGLGHWIEVVLLGCLDDSEQYIKIQNTFKFLEISNVFTRIIIFLNSLQFISLYIFSFTKVTLMYCENFSWEKSCIVVVSLLLFSRLWYSWRIEFIFWDQSLKN